MPRSEEQSPCRASRQGPASTRGVLQVEAILLGRRPTGAGATQAVCLLYCRHPTEPSWIVWGSMAQPSGTDRSLGDLKTNILLVHPDIDTFFVRL